MKKWMLCFCLCTLLATPALAQTTSSHGVVSYPSQWNVTDTSLKLQRLISAKGLKVFTVVDHQKNAAGVNLQIPPAQLIIFGNPKIGTQLMQKNLQAALDLPQKFLVWQAPNGKVMISYNAPEYLKKRHQLGNLKVLEKIEVVLAALAKGAGS